MSRHQSTRNISSKSMHASLSNLAYRHTDRQTNTGKNIYFNVASGSGMTSHWNRPNVPHIGILHLVSISTCHSAPVSEILSKSDHPRQKKMTSIDTIAVNCLVFEKIAFFCILATNRQTDRRTDWQHRCTKPLSLSRTAAYKGNKADVNNYRP